MNPTNTKEVVAVTAGGADIGFSTNAGASWKGTKSAGIAKDDGAPWVPYLTRSPKTPSLILYGSKRVNLSQDGGQTWQPFEVRPDLREVATSVAFGKDDDAKLWSLWSDGKVFLSTDGGTTWADKSPPAGRRYGTSIRSGDAPGTVFVSYSGTGGTRLFRTLDDGTTWTNIGIGFPAVNINSLAVDPNAPQLLYAATDAGVALSSDRGTTWGPLDEGFPTAVTIELCLDSSTNRLVAATYGRGLWEWRVPPEPVAAFAGLRSAVAGQNVMLHNESQYATSSSWSFGDGATSTESDPVHVFAAPGKYNVTLTASSDGGSSTASTTIDVIAARTGRHFVKHPPLLPRNPVLWLRADSGVETSGDRIARWENLANPDFWAFQNDAAFRPEFVVDALAHRPVARFTTGQSMTLVSSGLLGSQQFTFVVLARVTGSGMFLSNQDGAPAPIWFGILSERVYTNGTFVTTAFKRNVWSTVTMTRDAQNEIIHVDGVRATPIPAGVPRTLRGSWRIAADYGSSELQIAEILAYDRPLTTSERANAEAYLRASWLSSH